MNGFHANLARAAAGLMSIALPIGVLVAIPADALASTGKSAEASAAPAGTPIPKPSVKPALRPTNNGLHGSIVPGNTHAMRVDAAHGNRAVPQPATGSLASQSAETQGNAASGSSPTTGDDLTYGGSRVMHNTTTYLIFWVPTDATLDGTVRSLDEQFLTDLGGRYFNILGQYYDVDDSGTQHNIEGLTHFGGAWVDTEAYPPDPTPQIGGPAGSQGDPIEDPDIQDEVQRAINANPSWNAPGLSTLYEVVLGDNVEWCMQDGSCSFNPYGSSIDCGYHGDFHVNGTPVIYANISNVHCGDVSSPNNDNHADEDVSTLSHETFEAITDPLLTGGWRSPYGHGDEIGDLCEASDQFPAAVTADRKANFVLNGHEYEIQGEWSNQKSDASKAGTPNAGCALPQGAIESSAEYPPYPGCTSNVLTPNDDGSSPQVTLPFTVNFFSKPFNSLWVNNNGNVTFDGPQSTYTPYGLQSTSREIIAPFFADVDSRGTGTETDQTLYAQKVTYGGEPAVPGEHPAYFCVDWINVGYYGDETDKLNSFQLLLIDQSALGQAGDFNIVFNYDKIEWETGDASDGYDGLGGYPAVVGYSNGSTRSLQLPFSGASGAFEDDGYASLTQGNLNSSTPGRYIFEVRNGNTPTGGSIHGTVTDYLGNLVRNVPVQACGGTTGACALTQTNGQGNYSLAGLPPDNYGVTANPPTGSALLPGYVLAPVADGSDTEADLELYDESGPPLDVTITYHRLTADGVPVLEWSAANTLTYIGCPSGTVTARIALNDGTGQETFNLTEAVNVGFHTGYYSATIPDFYPLHGAATVTINATCPDVSLDENESFNIYIDPSGVVIDQDGKPVPNATVVLLRSDTADGPFLAVPDGSALMSPGNRANPDTTSADGSFGWDVLTGYYKVQASKADCSDPADSSEPTVTSSVFQVPPPMTQLHLVLDCLHADPTTLSYTGPTTADTHDALTPTAKLIDASTGQPVAGATVTLAFADAQCTATTDANGDAGCALTPNAASGQTIAQANFAGTDNLQPASSGPTVVRLLPDETVLSLVTPPGVAAGQPTQLRAVLAEDGTTPLAGQPVTLTLGSGAAAQSCTASTDSAGIVTCAVTSDQPLGAVSVSGAFAGDGYDAGSTATTSTMSFAYLDSGSFVIGDGNALPGDTVTFWSPQWCAQNGVTGQCPASFKGFADSPGAVPYSPGATWTARPGASSNPPASLPAYMAVITTGSVGKTGPTISGTITRVVIVAVQAGAGGTRTGIVVATLG